MFKTSLKFIKGNVIYTILCPLLIILDVIIEIELPNLTGGIVDALYAMENGGSHGDVLKQVGIMMLYTVATLAVGVVANFCATKASSGFGMNARKYMFDKVQDFSFENIDKFTSASLITRVTRDINSIQTVFRSFLVSFIKAPILIVSALIYAIRISPELSKIFIYSVPALTAALVAIGCICVPMFKKLLEKIDRFNGTIRENANGIRVVKAFVREDHERKKFKDINDEVLHWNIKAQNLMLFVTPFIMVIMYACLIITLWDGSNILISRTFDDGKFSAILAQKYATEVNLTPGKLLSLTSYIMSVLTSLMTIMMVFVSIISAKASINRVKEVIMEEPSIKDDDADESLLVADGSIEFKDVVFRYRKKAVKPILDKVSLKINSGETIGIIGGTGSSKSTLVNLIPRLYDADEGEIFIGGRNIKDYKLFNLRDSVSMVPQQNTLFSGTIKENISWGKENATDEEIIEACRIACADEFIEGFVDKYDTVLGSGGVNLSGGQKQRLCIARAIIKHPKILILDDSTSAVDTKTEALIREGLEADKFVDTTKIIIAQRITSVMHADRIAIIDGGKIDAVGTHEQLLESNKIYKEIYVSQQEGVLADV